MSSEVDKEGDKPTLLERLTAMLLREPDDREELLDILRGAFERHLLDAASERIARRVPPRHFQVFELYVRRRTPVLQVARELGLNPASIYLIGSRLTRQLKAEVAKLREQLG